MEGEGSSDHDPSTSSEPNPQPTPGITTFTTRTTTKTRTTRTSNNSSTSSKNEAAEGEGGPIDSNGTKDLDIPPEVINQEVPEKASMSMSGISGDLKSQESKIKTETPSKTQEMDLPIEINRAPKSSRSGGLGTTNPKPKPSKSKTNAVPVSPSKTEKIDLDLTTELNRVPKGSASSGLASSADQTKSKSRREVEASTKNVKFSSAQSKAIAPPPPTSQSRTPTSPSYPVPPDTMFTRSGRRISLITPLPDEIVELVKWSTVHELIVLTIFPILTSGIWSLLESHIWPCPPLPHYTDLMLTSCCLFCIWKFDRSFYSNKPLKIEIWVTRLIINSIGVLIALAWTGSGILIYGPIPPFVIDPEERPIPGFKLSILSFMGIIGAVRTLLLVLGILLIISFKLWS